MELLQPHAGVDPFDPKLHQAKQVGGVPGRAGRSDLDPLLTTIDTEAEKAHRPRTLSARLQHAGKVGHDLLDRFRGSDRLKQASLDDGSGRIVNRGDRLGRGGESLIEAEDRRQAETPREGRPGNREEVSDRLEPEPPGCMERDRLETESGNRQRRESVDGQAGADDHNLLVSEPSERVRGSRRTGDGYAGGDPGAGAERSQTSAEALLATMEVRAAREVEPEPVWVGDSHQWGPAPNRQEREAGEERGIGLRLGRSEIEVRD